MYRILQLLIIKRYATYDFVQLKLTATLFLLIKIYHSTNLGGVRLSKNRESIIKALAKFNTLNQAVKKYGLR